MLKRGVYPAAVTPFGPDGRIDMPGVARLLAFFESKGCVGAVLAGTNGEGPSLSAVEKRDLIKQAMPLRGTLDLILGIATPSLDEAKWLCEQGAKCGSEAALVMPPGYFREATESGIVSWFVALMEASPLPVIVYNFPQRTGIELTATMLNELSAHERMVGVKDSSGNFENLAAFKKAVSSKSLFVGNETLLWQALGAGWTGSISGVANVLPGWLSQIVKESGTESGQVKFELVLPMIEALRSSLQPAMNKALLHLIGVLPCAGVRLPLTNALEVDARALQGVLEATLGSL